jgi:hypothetical protein
MEFLISIVVIIFFAILIIGYKKGKLGAPTLSPDTAANEETLEKRNLFGKDGVKLISYNEALEASKQFIYDITRAVMQRFTPDAKKELSNVGRTLLKAGMQYFHVVDIFSLSLQKQRHMSSQKQLDSKQAASGKSKGI